MSLRFPGTDCKYQPSMKFFFSIIFLFGCLVQGTAQIVAQDQEGEYDVFLLIGQSNMAGSGYMLPEDAVQTLHGTWLLNDKGKPEPATGSLNRYSSVRKPNLNRIGPGNSFGPAIAEATGRKVLLVVNALGGSSIRYWAKKGPRVNDRKSIAYKQLRLYDEAVRRTKEALRYGKLKAILWQQGEADAGKWAEYPEKLAALVADLRSDLNAPDVPFIVGELAYWRESFRDFNTMIQNVSDFIPNSVCRSAAGLNMRSTESDPHFDREGHLELGKRYAEIVLRRIYPDVVGPAPAPRVETASADIRFDQSPESFNGLAEGTRCRLSGNIVREDIVSASCAYVSRTMELLRPVSTLKTGSGNAFEIKFRASEELGYVIICARTKNGQTLMRTMDIHTGYKLHRELVTLDGRNRTYPTGEAGGMMNLRFGFRGKQIRIYGTADGTAGESCTLARPRKIRQAGFMASTASELKTATGTNPESEGVILALNALSTPTRWAIAYCTPLVNGTPKKALISFDRMETIDKNDYTKSTCWIYIKTEL